MKAENSFTRFVIIIWGMILILRIFTFCTPDRKNQASEEYLASYNEWKINRMNSLKGSDGWLNLAGLFWLEEGENSFGSDSSNSIIFPPGAPAKIGVIILKEDKIRLVVNTGIEVIHEGELIPDMDLMADVTGDPTLLSLDSLAWFIIKRGDKYGIRLRDYNHPDIHRLDTIPHFPFSPDWKIIARLESIPGVKTIRVPNVLGMVEDSPVPGVLVFSAGKQDLTLYPMGDPEHLFLVFGDETSGLETYGGGRFLNLDPPDEEGNYTIDFNKAYNPPCAFTPYATCPLPPKENVMSIRVTAGEKEVEGFGYH